MSFEETDDGHLRKYLLGELSEAEQQAFEERLLREDELFELLPLAEEELIDDYLGGELSQDERGRFESYFLATPDRRRKLSFAMALRRYVTVEEAAADEALAGLRVAPAQDKSRPFNSPSRWWNRVVTSPAIRVAAAATIMLAVGLGIWQLLIRESVVDKGLEALARAYRNERPIEGRISGFDYAARPNTRGPGRESVDYVARDSAERFLFDAVQERPDAGSYHALGRLYLAEHKFSEATDQFEKALSLQPNDAKVHSDYGAALLEIGKASESTGESGRSFEEFARSNEHLNKALELDASLLEAMFNRAMCHEYLQLYQQAEEDWKEYLSKDQKSKWSDEARQRLKELQDRPRQTSIDTDQLLKDFIDAHKAGDDEQAWKLIRESRGPAGSLIEGKLIDAYLDLALRGKNDEAGAKLVELSYTGRLEYRRSGDPCIANLARFYGSASPSQLHRVSRARDLMRNGRERMSKQRFDEALGFFSEAKPIFEGADDKCEALSAGLSIGNCHLQQSRAKLALSSFQSVAQACEAARYRWLLSQTLCAIANARLYLREFSAAIGDSERSMNLSKELGDTKGFLRALFQLAEEYRFVNRKQKALDLHVQDLYLTHLHLAQPEELWRNYFSLSLTFYQLDLPITAIDFQKEAVHLASESRNPRLLCRTYNYLGMLMARHGDYVAAAANIDRALEIGNSFAEREIAVEATAPSFLQMGYVSRKTGNYDRAVENYDRAIQAYQELDSNFFEYTARKEKLLCCMELGRCASIEREMEDLLELFEEQRSKILEETNRTSYFDAEQGIYDMAIEFEYYKKKDTNKAFEYSERSRGRSLRDLMNPSAQIVDDPSNPDWKFYETSQAMSLDKILLDMPREAQVLQYAVLKSDILIWVVTQGSGEPFTTSRSIAIEELDKKVRDFREIIRVASEDDLSSFTREAAFFYDLLIRPVESQLDGNKLLCIVPDKSLNDLPFAALKSSVAEHYLFQRQRRGLLLAPSSTMFVMCSQAAAEKMTSKPERALSVGDPLYDRVRFSGLDELQAASREASEVAGFYGSDAPLIGTRATKLRVMHEMESSDVIHLATHAVTDELYPLCSKLLLAKDPAAADNSDGVLQAYEIRKLNLDRAKLVVLSACRTAVENYFGGEGMVGLSRPFIAKGIPLVVGSLWKVESGPTADLMISFHQHRKRDGLPTAEALRQAQIDMLGDSGSKSLPRCWSSFVAIGGYADF